MSKNIVICCDGTGNEYGARNSNVVNLYAALDREPIRQVTYYDPGVGTFSAHPVVTGIGRSILKTLGKAIGHGITQNVEDAYRFIMQNYEEGDRLYMFGFSRGAYTVRAVAAMLYKCWLLYPDNENLIPYALKQFKRERNRDVYEGFRSTFCRRCPIRFLGLWDTVTSVGWIWNPKTLPYTTNNPAVAVVRQAISVDERRAFFRQNLWGDSEDQDIKQVWFPGVHSDVGGGYAEGESGLSKVALEWMFVEAQNHGILLRDSAAKGMLTTPPVPDHKGKIHKSLTWKWWLGEFWPKRHVRGWPRMNMFRRRHIESGSVIHESVIGRIADIKEYCPKNIPKKYETEPWISYGDQT